MIETSSRFFAVHIVKEQENIEDYAKFIAVETAKLLGYEVENIDELAYDIEKVQREYEKNINQDEIYEPEFSQYDGIYRRILQNIYELQTDERNPIQIISSKEKIYETVKNYTYNDKDFYVAGISVVIKPQPEGKSATVYYSVLPVAVSSEPRLSGSLVAEHLRYNISTATKRLDRRFEYIRKEIEELIKGRQEQEKENAFTTVNEYISEMVQRNAVLTARETVIEAFQQDMKAMRDELARLRQDIEKQLKKENKQENIQENKRPFRGLSL